MNTLAMFPYGMSLLVINSLPLYLLLHKYIHIRPSAQHTFTLTSINKKIILIVYHAMVAMVAIFFYESACQHCSSNATKPLLTAHRGCSMDAPENTLYSFEQAAKIPSVTTLESDVQISKDGYLFLLHDNTLARTTDIRSTCPFIDPHFNASFLYYSTGKCPLDKLSIKANSSLGIPTLESFLDIAIKYDKNIIFDLYLPHHEHPYREKYLQQTLDVIIHSKIQLEKV